MKIILNILLNIILIVACSNNDFNSNVPDNKPSVSYVTFSEGSEIYATIHGSNFGDFEGKVYFSGQEAMNYSYWNHFMIIAKAPTMVARNGTVWVVVNGIKSNEQKYSF